MQTIKNNRPNPPDNVVFYTESDHSFYGLPVDQRIMPFQSGFGQTLLVWYNQTENFPSEFLRDRFLWEITSQGYRVSSGRGFGYFRDFNVLAKAILENELNADSVVSFRYDLDTDTLTDNTNEVRGRLRRYFSKKIKTDRTTLKINASVNPEE